MAKKNLYNRVIDQALEKVGLIDTIKNKTIVSGGLLINLEINETANTYKTFVNDKEYQMNITNDFISLSKTLGDVINMNYNAISTNEATASIFDKQKSLIQDGINNIFADAKKQKNLPLIKDLLISNSLSHDKNLANEAADVLNKPRGIRGAMFNTTRVVANAFTHLSDTLDNQKSYIHEFPKDKPIVDDDNPTSTNNEDAPLTSDQLLKQMQEGFKVMQASQETYLKRMQRLANENENLSSQERTKAKQFQNPLLNQEAKNLIEEFKNQKFNYLNIRSRELIKNSMLEEANLFKSFQNFIATPDNQAQIRDVLKEIKEFSVDNPNLPYIELYNDTIEVVKNELKYLSNVNPNQNEQVHSQQPAPNPAQANVQTQNQTVEQSQPEPKKTPKPKPKPKPEPKTQAKPKTQAGATTKPKPSPQKKEKQAYQPKVKDLDKSDPFFDLKSDVINAYESSKRIMINFGKTNQQGLKMSKQDYDAILSITTLTLDDITKSDNSQAPSIANSAIQSIGEQTTALISKKEIGDQKLKTPPSANAQEEQFLKKAQQDGFNTEVINNTGETTMDKVLEGQTYGIENIEPPILDGPPDDYYNDADTSEANTDLSELEKFNQEKQANQSTAQTPTLG